MAEGKQSFKVDHNEEEEMLINQEFKIWKKESPYSYDYLYTRTMDWPTCTFQWLPHVNVKDGIEYHEAIICQNSIDPELCELQKIRISVPEPNNEQNFIKSEEPKFEIIERNVLGFQTNRARYCPAANDLVAASMSNGEIILIKKDYSPIRLVCHTQEGFGLSWNQISPNLLATGNSDKRICVWDMEKTKIENQKDHESNKAFPTTEIHHHNTPVEDVAWHKFHPNILASCSDDRMIMLWDLRFRSCGTGNAKPLFEIVSHTNEVYTLDFSPFNEFLYLSGSADENTSMWDMRNLTRSVQNFKTQGSVVKVEWSPNMVNLFGCCGYDRKVFVWDLSQQQTEPFFTHQGHRSRVVDFDWNKNLSLMIGSVEDSNSVNLWQMKRSLYFKQ